MDKKGMTLIGILLVLAIGSFIGIKITKNKYPNKPQKAVVLVHSHDKEVKAAF